MPTGKSTRRGKRRRLQPQPVQAEPVGTLTPLEPLPVPIEATEPAETPLPAPAEVSEPVAIPSEPVVTPLQLPKHLMDRMEVAQKVVTDVQDEIKRFKEHPDFSEGSIPGTLYGLHGDPNVLGGQSLNFVDPKHIYSDTHIHWSERRMVDYHRGQGYEPFDKDKFDAMTTSLGGAYSYGHNAANHVTVGDLVLIRTSRDHYEARERAKSERTKSREQRAKNTLYQAGEKQGVEVWEKDYAGPKLGKVIDLLCKEFGEEDIKRVFLKH